MKKRNGLKYIFLLVLIASCERTAPDKPTKEKPVQFILEARQPIPDSLKSGAKSVNGAILLIAHANEVVSKRVGEGGVTTNVYRAYELLQERATTSQLTGLLRHDSAAVRVYAFSALSKRDGFRKETSLKLLRRPDEIVYIMSGCTGSQETVKNLCSGNFLVEPAEVPAEN
jgi:hypothetical protein